MPKLRDPKPMSSFNPSRAALLHERLHVQIMVRDPSVLRIGDARPRHTTKAFTGMATSSMDGRLWLLGPANTTRRRSTVLP